MKPFLSAIALATLGASTCSLQAVRADVAWQHSISVRAGQNLRPWTKPDAKITMLNEWSGMRHRTLLRIKSSDMQNLPPLPMPGGMMGDMGMHAWTANGAARKVGKNARAQANQKAGATVDIVSIIDRDGDKFTMYGAPKREYIQEPLKATLKRLRFDPWKKLAPRLSEETPEPLSERQRERLGAEVRSAYRPFMNKVVKLYFRDMNQSRTVAGVEGRVYRLTALFNTGTQQRPAWAQMRAQWVVGNELPGDSEVRDFQKSSRDLLREVGWPSASLWINELSPMMLHMMPQEVVQSLQTLMPREGSPREFFAGTPLELFVTVSPPPLERRLAGEVRLSMILESRSTDTLPDSLFVAPKNYTRTPLEPQLKEYDKLMTQIAKRQEENPSPFLGLFAP